MKYLKKLSLLSMVLLAFVFVACSSDDDNNSSDDTLQLEGEWKFNTMNFLDDSVQWDPELDYTSANTFGYAPYMFDYAGVKGFIYGTTPVESNAGENLGKRFDYILSGNFGQDPEEAYWYWNYTEDGQSFDMEQVNPSFPPHDYSIKNISDVSVDGNQLTFKGYLKSRIVGGSMQEMELTPVEFSLTKGTASAPVEIMIQGEPFVAPE